jgi:hypothetical protein
MENSIIKTENVGAVVDATSFAPNFDLEASI